MIIKLVDTFNTYIGTYVVTNMTKEQIQSTIDTIFDNNSNYSDSQELIKIVNDELKEKGVLPLITTDLSTDIIL